MVKQLKVYLRDTKKLNSNSFCLGGDYASIDENGIFNLYPGKKLKYLPKKACDEFFNDFYNPDESRIDYSKTKCRVIYPSGIIGSYSALHIYEWKDNLYWLIVNPDDIYTEYMAYKDYYEELKDIMYFSNEVLLLDSMYEFCSNSENMDTTYVDDKITSLQYTIKDLIKRIEDNIIH